MFKGRPPNQIFFDSVTTTTLSISWAVSPDESLIPFYSYDDEDDITDDVFYQINLTDEYGRTIPIVSSAAVRPAGSGIRALSHHFADLMPGYGYSIVITSSDLETELCGFKRTGEYYCTNVIELPAASC